MTLALFISWEQRKLYEVADFNPKSELPETFEYVDLESVVGTEMISHRTETRDTAPSRAQRLAQTGDVFFQTVRPYQRNNYLFEKPDNNYVFSTGYAQMRPKIDAEFLMCFLQTDSFVKVVLDNCTGTSYPAINSNDLSNLEIFLPVSEDEQRKIGGFITNIDNLITLHQCRKKPLCSSRWYKTISWEQRKLGEVFEEYSEKKHEELPPLTIIQGGGTILREESDRALQYDKNSLSGYKMVKKNDFIVHLRSFEGGLEKANSDGIISPAYHTFHGDNTDSRFYYPFFRSRRFIDVLLKPHVYGIRDGKSIDIEGMKTIMIPVPSYAEQKKIGEYIESLDNLITLHQCKCLYPILADKKIRKYFDYNNTTDWEQRKLGEISDKVTKKNQDVAVEEVFTNSAEFGIISQRDFFEKDIANAENIDGYYVVEPDDFVYNPRISTTAPFGPIKRNKLERTGTMSPLYYVFRPHDIDLSYLEWFFQTTCWHAFMRFNGNSGARSDRFAITDKIFNEMPISMPQDIEEQKKLGTFLTELDNLITLHQRGRKRWRYYICRILLKTICFVTITRSGFIFIKRAQYARLL